MSIISNLVNKSVISNRPLNILSFFFDGKFDIELLETGHNFYGCLEHSANKWPGYRNRDFNNLHFIPSNHYMRYTYDFVLFNDREKHGQFFDICRHLHAPGLLVDHGILKHNNFVVQQLKNIPLESVSCSLPISKQLGNSYINYGIENTIGEYDKDINILLCGNFGEQDYFSINNIKKAFPSLRLFGDNPKLEYSESVNTYKDYQNLFKRTNIFLNLATQNPINYDILYALKSKAIIITYSNQGYEDILKDGENCLIANNPEAVIKAIKDVAHNQKLKFKLSSYEIDLSQFNKPTFINDWNQIFAKQRDKVYVI